MILHGGLFLNNLQYPVIGLDFHNSSSPDGFFFTLLSIFTLCSNQKKVTFILKPFAECSSYLPSLIKTWLPWRNFPNVLSENDVFFSFTSPTFMHLRQFFSDDSWLFHTYFLLSTFRILKFIEELFWSKANYSHLANSQAPSLLICWHTHHFCHSYWFQYLYSWIQYSFWVTLLYSCWS